MALVSVNQVRLAALEEREIKRKSADSILTEAARFSLTKYDIFLSHSKMDSNLVLGAKRILERKGFSVYIDWIDDPQLDRSKVSKSTADILRKRMRGCTFLLYLHTKNSVLSKWCPWELGYFDGFTYPTPKVFIFPLVSEGERKFQGQEYLGLYPTIDIDNPDKIGGGKSDVWRHDSSATSPFRKIINLI